MDIIRKYFSDLNKKQLEQFALLQTLYEEWNTRINVVSRKDIEQLYERHVLHSLGIAMHIRFKPGTKVMDVGTGGGFPGIPLAIVNPETDFYLVDSIGKKIKVATEVATAIELKNVTTEQIRAEKVNQRFDFIVSRAVTAFPKFVALVRTKVSAKSKNLLDNGILYLKGGDFEEELKLFGKSAKVYNLSSNFEEEFFETKRLIHLLVKNR